MPQDLTGVITLDDLPEPVFAHPDTQSRDVDDLSLLDLADDVSIETLSPTTGEAARVIDHFAHRLEPAGSCNHDAATVAVYRFPDLASAQRGAHILTILHLLDRAASGASTTVAAASLTDLHAGATSARIAVMTYDLPYVPEPYFVIDNRRPGTITTMATHADAILHYKALLDPGIIEPGGALYAP